MKLNKAKIIQILSFTLIVIILSMTYSYLNINGMDFLDKKDSTSNFETTEINCDSIYPSKNYKIKLLKFDTLESYENINTIFELRKGNNIVFSDSIHNRNQYIKFEDYTGDKVKDILINYESSARSNWTFTLYLLDTLKDQVKKIRGFEEIPNPRYLSKFDLVDCYALSGINWTSFYKIQNDTIIDLGIQIEDDLMTNKYEVEYKKAIKKIMKKLKSSKHNEKK